MNRMQMGLLSLMVLALLVTSVGVQAAETGIRFNATLHMPAVSVSVGNFPSGHYPIYKAGYLPIRRLQPYRIGKRDRKIAHRLARYTGAPAGELIKLKRRGYSWFEIGRWLRLPPSVVRAAMQQQIWNRFLRAERRIVQCSTYRVGRHR